jgi:hypothetical protein
MTKNILKNEMFASENILFFGNAAHDFMPSKCTVKYTKFFLLGCFHHLKNG